MSKEKKESNKVSKKTLILTSIVLTIVFTALFLCVVLVTNPEAAEAVKKIDWSFTSEKEHYTSPIEFIAEISGENNKRRYINVEITLTLNDKKKAGQLQEEQVKLTDLYIRYFSTKTEEELRSDEGQNKVKEDLKDKIKSELGEDIEGVYFTKWLFQ